jgi:hypothetical protein
MKELVCPNCGGAIEAFTCLYCFSSFAPPLRDFMAALGIDVELPKPQDHSAYCGRYGNKPSGWTPDPNRRTYSKRVKHPGIKAKNFR